MNHANMKKLFLLSAIVLVTASVPAQTYKITWGEEIKLKKGTADLDVVAADNTGLYFTETRVQVRSSFLIGATYGAAVKLMKLDKNFAEVFDKEYKKELKGLNFHSFQALGNDLYLFATDYERKTKRFLVYGSKVNKTNGDLDGDFIELGSYELESRKDDYEMKIRPVLDGNYFLMVSNISGKERVTIAVQVLDKNFKQKESAIINLENNPDEFTLTDVVYTKSNKIVLLGKEYELSQWGKKKKKRMVFKQYNMAVYSRDGKKEHDVSLETENRFVITGKLIEQPTGELLLAGFYSNAAKKEDLNGFYINKVDPENGTLLLSSFKEINSGMLGKSFVDETDDDDMSKQEKKQAQQAKDNDDEDDFPNAFVIKNVTINPADNSVIITSEVSQYSYYSYTNSQYNSQTRSWTYTTTHVHRFTNKDLLIINADKNGNIRWLNALPKSQVEEIRTTNSGYSPGWSYDYSSSGYFANAGGMPFYSSYSSLISGNNLILLLNDHTSNNINPEYGDKVKTIYNFRKRSNVYGISVDLSTGKFTRKFIASNNDETILMPRHAYAVGNEFFVPSWRPHLMAKTELKFAKISVR